MLLDFDDIHAGNARDVLAAIPDALSLALGAHDVQTPHPFADWAAEAPLRAAAYAAGMVLNPRQSGETQAAVIGRGLRTQNFGNAVAAGLEAAARRKFDLQGEHLSAVATVECTKLNVPEKVGALDQAAVFGNVSDGLEYKISKATLLNGEKISLSSLGRLIGITREIVFNDDLGLIEDAVAGAGIAAARHEARLVAAALEANGNLSDGSPVFAAAHGNVSTGSGVLSSASVGDVMRLLRTQPAADGEALNATAVSLFVSPVGEFIARQIVFTTGLPITVHTLPGMAGDRFYLAASPDVARNIAVARLSGAAHPLAIEAVKTPLSFDGVMIRCRIDTGAAMIGRTGIARCSS